MNQIYYTQCPIGYGLGASSGFQIKRLSPGYPVSSDYRHFSLRAFVGGTRLPAPATLRYRRGEGDVAEIAWLTPRSHEYETERGPWGRPGGHFAHGLQLDAAELRALGDWPAGLFDRPFWTRSDRAPSRGQPPPDLELSAADLDRPPTFAAVAPLADGEDGDLLARLLTALAAAALAGRTLFLIDEPARLARRIALLTFAFPEPWRASLTFSTYHERPEELTGFRLQGTIPMARPNRPALLAQGFVADLASGSGTIEPGVEPAGWARTLAGWLIRHQGADQADWESTRRRAGRARAGPEGPWADEWLERIFGLPGLIRAGAPIPASARAWSELVAWPAWTHRSGLADEWAGARPPAWWLAAAKGDGPRAPESSAALLEHLRLPEAWQGTARAEAWGEVVARWVGPADDAVRLKTTSAALAAAPAAARPSFAGGLIRRLAPEAAASTLSWLAAQTGWDRSILLPLEAHGAVTQAIEARDGRALQELLQQSMALPGATAAMLDALEAEADDRPGARAVLAEQLAVTLGTGAADLRGVFEVHRWALGLGQAERTEAWLDPFWRRLFADRLNVDLWRAFFQRLPREVARPLIPVVLHVALSSRAVDEALRWGIEELVLPLEEAERPHDSAWPGAYLDRLPSGLDLLKRLVKKPYRRLGVRRWLEQARERGALSEAQASRLDDCQRYERALKVGDAHALLEVKLPDVPTEERGTLLRQILHHLGDGSDEALNLAIDTCRAAWPEGFAPGAAGLASLAEALAEPLLAERGYPELWLERLQRILDRLGLATPPAHGFESDGLAALAVAVTTRHPGETFDPWRLRESLLRNDLAWKALAADVRRDIEDVPAEECPKVLDDWDQALAKGAQTARFYELWFNVASGPQLVHLVVSRTVDTKNFTIPWWDADRSPGARNDVRERLVREGPMVPLRQGSLTSVRNWLRRSANRLARPCQEDLVPIEGESAPQGTYEWLISDEGRSRWSFLEELSLFAMAGSRDARLERLKSWSKLLPLERLAASDRYVLLASIITLVEDDDPVLVACLAKWLFKGNASDVDQIKCWDQKLALVDPVPHELVLMRVALVRRLCDELNTLRREARERGEKRGPPAPPELALSGRLSPWRGAGKRALERPGMPEQGENPLVVGIDLGGTKILAAVVAADNTILGRSKAPTPAHEGGPAILQAIVACVDGALAEARLGRGDIVAAGIGSPGPLDPDTGVILFSANMNLRDFPLGPGLSQALGWPVLVQNDVRAGGYAEFRLGAAKGCTDVIAAFVGTGIGGCIISRGQVLTGATGNAGEIGHIVIKANGLLCGCGARGCLEAMASRSAIVHRVNKAIRKGTPTILREKMVRKGGRLKSGDLADAVAAGDQVAVSVVSRAAHYLGLGLGSLINALGPQIVVIGGGVAEALGDPWIAQVRAVARGQTLVDRDGKIRIEPAALGDDAGIHGAALLARERFVDK